jgi:hypothetical protein
MDAHIDTWHDLGCPCVRLQGPAHRITLHMWPMCQVTWPRTRGIDSKPVLQNSQTATPALRPLRAWHACKALTAGHHGTLQATNPQQHLETWRAAPPCRRAARRTPSFTQRRARMVCCAWATLCPTSRPRAVSGSGGVGHKGCGVAGQRWGPRCCPLQAPVLCPNRAAASPYLPVLHRLTPPALPLYLCFTAQGPINW